MREVSHPSTVAVDERTMKWPWEEAQMTALPSWSQSTTQACGSM